MTATPFSCPKRMVYGPCGGVRPNHDCEAAPEPCPFADSVVVPPPGEVVHRPRPLDLGTAIIDLVLPPADDELDAIVDIYRSLGAVALVGEHLDDPRPHIPHVNAERLAVLAQPAILTVTGRWRSTDEHADEVGRLVDAGVVAVHCVTGDHPAARFGPHATAPFTLDGTRLAGIARAAGANVSVGESPAAPPTADRPARLAAKERAGADLAILNHAGTTSDLIAFADRVSATGATLSLVAPVPVVTDERSAKSLAAFPGLVLDDGLVDRVLGSATPRATGIAAAVAMGRTLLDSGRFSAVNLSGFAHDLTAVQSAEVMASIAGDLE